MTSMNSSLNEYCYKCSQVIPPEQQHCPECHENYDADEQHCPECHENYDADEQHCPECHENYDLDEQHCPECHENYDLDEQHCPECHESYEKDQVHEHNDVSMNLGKYDSHTINSNTEDTVELVLEFGSEEKESNPNISDIISNPHGNEDQHTDNSHVERETDKDNKPTSKVANKTLDFNTDYSYFTIL